MQQEPDEIYLYPHPCGGFLHRYSSFFQRELNNAIHPVFQRCGFDLRVSQFI
jgi:hypothetical protein